LAAQNNHQPVGFGTYLAALGFVAWTSSTEPGRAARWSALEQRRADLIEEEWTMATLEAELRRLLRIVADDELCDSQSALVEIVSEMRHVAAEDQLDFESALNNAPTAELAVARRSA
jgi:hypothetical protein